MITHSRDSWLRTTTASVSALLLLGTAVRAQQEAKPAFYPVEDHLVPAMLDTEKDFRVIMEKRLLVVAGICARMVDRPSPASEGESGISVYPKASKTSGQEFLVTYVRAEKNLWYYMSENSSVRPKQNVHVSRIDAKIPNSTALVVLRAWKEMLTTTRQYDYRGEFRVPLGFDVFEFSLIGPDGKVRYGETPIPGRSSTEQAAITKIVRLGQMLGSYCKAQPAKRPAISKQIEDDANRMIAELQSKHSRK